MTRAADAIYCTGITIVNRDRGELREGKRMLLQRVDIHECCSTGAGHYEMLNGKTT
jgi:hypothetical protein